MAKKIKFPLEMANGVQVRTLEDLRENFDMEKILYYYMDGKLITWLNDRYYENEASQITELDKSRPDFKSQFCKILGVENNFNDSTDLEVIERRNAKIAKLKQFTDDEEFIKNIDFVAFNQEEMSDLLDDGITPIYLCGERFTIPISKENITYIGVNSPTVIIKSKSTVDFPSKHILFQNIIFNEEYHQLISNPKTNSTEGSKCVKGIYKTSPLLDYMMKNSERAVSERLFNVIFAELSRFTYDVDGHTKSKVKILKSARLDEAFERYIEKMC